MKCERVDYTMVLSEVELAFPRCSDREELEARAHPRHEHWLARIVRRLTHRLHR